MSHYECNLASHIAIARSAGLEAVREVGFDAPAFQQGHFTAIVFRVSRVRHVAGMRERRRQLNQQQDQHLLLTACWGDLEATRVSFNQPFDVGEPSGSEAE